MRFPVLAGLLSSLWVGVLRGLGPLLFCWYPRNTNKTKPSTFLVEFFCVFTHFHQITVEPFDIALHSSEILFPSVDPSKV